MSRLNLLPLALASALLAGCDSAEPNEDQGAAGMASAGGSGESGAFTLLYRDEFDTLDTARWQLMTHSWPGNLALFSATSVTVSGGELAITLLAAPPGTIDGGE